MKPDDQKSVPSSVRLKPELQRMVLHHANETGETAAVAMRSLIRKGYHATYPRSESQEPEA